MYFRGWHCRHFHHLKLKSTLLLNFKVDSKKTGIAFIKALSFCCLPMAVKISRKKKIQIWRTTIKMLSAQVNSLDWWLSIWLLAATNFHADEIKLTKGRNKTTTRDLECAHTVGSVGETGASSTTSSSRSYYTIVLRW